MVDMLPISATNIPITTITIVTNMQLSDTCPFRRSDGQNDLVIRIDRASAPDKLPVDGPFGSTHYDPLSVTTVG